MTEATGYEARTIHRLLELNSALSDEDTRKVSFERNEENPLEADVIITFDEHHRNAITRVLDYSHWDRIVLFNKIAFDEDGNVADPHFQTETVYRNVAEHIEKGCRRLVEKFKLQ